MRRIKGLIRGFLLTALVCFEAAHAVPVELFKGKPPARFDGYGITMSAKIIEIDCNSTLGYAKNSEPQCKVKAKYKVEDSLKERDITLYYDTKYADELREYMVNGTYGFASCTYSHYLKKLFDCSFK